MFEAAIMENPDSASIAGNYEQVKYAIKVRDFRRAYDLLRNGDLEGAEKLLRRSAVRFSSHDW